MNLLFKIKKNKFYIFVGRKNISLEISIRVIKVFHYITDYN